MTAACRHEKAEHDATARLTRATWALVCATVLLVMVTAMLAEATWAENQHHEAPATEGTVATTER